MAALEALLREQAMGDPGLAGMLATYGGRPAFFYSKSPPDTDRNWRKPCYPRADFGIDMRHDPERKVSGSITVNVFCTAESGAMPEEIERRLVGLVSGTFYSGQDMDTVCAVWERTDSFDDAGGGTPEVFGATATFGLMAFPAQATSEPDPIAALNAWTLSNFPEAATITASALPPIWRPTDDRPAIYWRPDGAETTDRQSHAVTWYSGQYAAHIIADGVAARWRWAKAMAERMQRDGEAPMLDGSPLFAQRISVRHGADPLREGQLILSGQYGILEQHRWEQAAEPLNNIIFPGFKGANHDKGKRYNG